MEALSKKQPSTHTKRTMSRKKWSERWFLLSVWIIPAILFVVLYVYINLNSFALAFKNILNDNFDWTFAGLDNFKKFIDVIFNDPTTTYVFSNSVTIYLINILIISPLQIMVAFFLYKKVFGTEMLKIILFLPQIIASVIWVMLFRYLCDYGAPILFEKLGIEETIILLDKDATIGFGMMIFYNAWIGLGAAMLLYMGTMARIPDSVTEAGKIDGMTLMKEFLYVIVPLVYPLLGVSLVTSVPTLFTNQLHIFTFFKDVAGPRLYTFGYYLFIQIIGSSTASVQQYSFAAAGGILITLVVAPLTFGMRWLVNKMDPEVSY